MTAGCDEIRRIILEEEPQKPSTRISTLGESLAAMRSHRKIDPRQLVRLVSGDLDWIVMKSLEKKRSRRYATATNLAADVRRYLQREPIEARPPSTLYRLRKWRREPPRRTGYRDDRCRDVTGRDRCQRVVGGVCDEAEREAQSQAVIARERELAAEHNERIATQRLKMVAQASYEQSFLDCLLNNQEQATKSLEIARAAGASVCQLEVLRGLLALNRGDNDVARQHAGNAVTLDGTSPMPEHNVL